MAIVVNSGNPREQSRSKSLGSVIPESEATVGGLKQSRLNFMSGCLHRTCSPLMQRFRCTLWHSVTNDFYSACILSIHCKTTRLSI